jgi:hypothetical protein
MDKFINYAKHVNASSEIINWVEKRIGETITTEEGEHVIDYLVSENPKLTTASYKDIKHNADKWMKKQIKKGEHIKETAEDTKLVLDFKDGFKVVQLIGENAYKREGYLMGHCVAGYFNKPVKVYSLRDENNMPHCTMEQDQQIKGKGNGDVHPKYIDYIVKFLEHIGMTVGDSEMAHLGYVNVEGVQKEEKDLVFPELYNKKYFNKALLKKVENKDRMSLWGIFGLFDFSSKLEVNFNFDIDKSVNFFREKLSKLKYGKVKKDNNKVAMTDSNEVAMTYNNEVAMTSSNKVAMTSDNKVAMTDSNKVAMTYNNEVAMTSSNKVAMTSDNKVAMTYNNEVAMTSSNKVAMTYNNDVAMASYNEVAMTDNNKVAMTYNNEVAMTSGNKVAMTDNNEVAMTDNNKVAMTSDNKVAMTSYNEVAMTSSNKVAMTSYNEVAMTSSNEVRCEKNNLLVGRRKNKIEIGEQSVAVMENESKVKGKKGSLIVLVERDNDNNIIFYKAEMVDGEKVKEDVWYQLRGGEFVEVSE